MYTKQDITLDNINNYLKDVKCEMISSVHKNLCDDFISTNEILNSMKQLAKGKSPGRDGLTAEFYHKFQSELTPILELLYNNIFLSNNKMTDSMNKGVITLI